MKKLLLFLSVIFVSVMGYSQARTTLNPYAYDLRTTWKSERVLNFSFKLNSHPNLSGTYGNSQGIMLKLIAPDGTVYRAIPVSYEDIYSNSKFTKEYSFDLDFDKYQNKYGQYPFDGIPANVDIAWQVDVAGESSNVRTNPVVTCWNAAYRPVSTHGVAVSKGYNSTDFGRIYATVFNGNSETIIQNTYTWLKTKTPSVIKYEPMDLATDGKIPTTYTATGFQASNDPHRVRVSDDGRMFVSSQWTGASSVVWECTNGVYKGIITRTSNNGRIVAMDVRGTGENLTMLLCEVKTNAGTYSSGQAHAQLIIREYAIGKLESGKTYTVDNGTPVAYYNDFRTSEGYQGLIHQAYTGSGWSLQQEGLINVAYGSGDAIWLKVDFFLTEATCPNSRIVYYNRTNTGQSYKDDKGNAGTPSPPSGIYVNKMPWSGGDGLLINGNTLITGTVDYIRFYTINNNGSLTEQTGNRVYTKKDTFRGTAEWVTDLAIDPANNVYAVSSDAMNLMVISLPYSGLTTTKAPDKYKFKVPYPASNLQYAPVEGKNQYKFTFKVDATPRTVDVRFYTTKEQMLKGGNDYAFHYSAFTTIGKFNMSVTFDAVKGTITPNRELNDPDGNGVLNLPPGEYYWCVCVNGTATPSSDNYCYIPERLSHDMVDTEMNLALETPKGLDLYRPFQGGMYNTICLPFDLDVKTLDSNHPYYNATVLAFDGATISTINDESVLELNFVSTDGVIKHSTPYLIRPQSDISSGVRFDNIILQPVLEFPASEYLVNKNDINYLGVMGKGGFSFDPNEEIVLILVSDNRLAQLSSGGTIDGFRGLFYFDKGVISAGAVVKLTERKDTPTSLIDAQGEVIDVEKFLREGRVFIRVGESLYTVDGQLVK